MSQNIDFEEVKHDTSLASLWCDSCSRIEEDGGRRWLNLGDGRELCSDCSSIAVMNSDECSFIIQSVFEFFRKEELKVDENIPILFLDRIQIRRYLRRDDDSLVGYFLPSMSTFIKAPHASSLPAKLMIILARSIVARIPTIEKYSRSGGDIRKGVKLVLGHVILLLFGKPDIELGANLAHEMMHVWLDLQGIQWGYEKRIVEGICEVMSYKWLEWFLCSGLDNPHKTNQQVQYTRELKELLVERMWCRGDEVYGQGFRDVMRAIETVGFQPTLDHVIKNATLPPTMFSTVASTTPSAKVTRKNTSTTPVAQFCQLLWMTTSNTTKSFLKATVATVTTCEAPRLIIEKGILTVVSICILIEHS